MRVLLAEDSQDLRELFTRALRRKGFEVRAAEDGRAALDCLSDFTPDLLVTDLMMPVLGGIELIRLFRAMPAMDSIPVMAITAAATKEAEQTARKAGADDFLAKPMDLSTLLTRIFELGTRPGPESLPGTLDKAGETGTGATTLTRPTRHEPSQGRTPTSKAEC